jgi:DNA-binding NarL/FixJ family response regulator
MGMRVLVADYQPLFRAGIKSALESERAVEIVGEAATAEEAIEKTAKLRPDVVVIDIAFPNGDGIATIRSIKARWPKAQVLVLTSLSNAEWFHKAASAGAVGYVLKDIDPLHLVNAVHSAYTGSTTLSANIAAQVFRQPASAAGAASLRPGAQSAPKPPLSENDVKVLAFVAQGFSDKQIAAKLFLSESAVKSRLRSLYYRFGFRNRAQAATFAFENGFITTSESILNGRPSGATSPRDVVPRDVKRNV